MRNGNMTAKWLVVLLAGILAVGMVGCSGTAQVEVKKTSPETNQTQTTAPGTTTSGPAETPSTTGNTTGNQQAGLDGEQIAVGNGGNTTPGSGNTTTTPGSSDSGSDPELAEAEKKLANYKGGRLAPAEFVAMFGPIARASMKKTGVPASVTLAQAALETGWGKSTIGDAKNLFGIKGTGPAGSIEVPTKEFVNGRYITIKAKFRKYNSWQESVSDHARLLSENARYRKAMANKNDAKQFAREIKKAGYATAPDYADVLISIMNSNNLYRFDK